MSKLTKQIESEINSFKVIQEKRKKLKEPVEKLFESFFLINYPLVLETFLKDIKSVDVFRSLMNTADGNKNTIQDFKNNNPNMYSVHNLQNDLEFFKLNNCLPFTKDNFSSLNDNKDSIEKLIQILVEEKKESLFYGETISMRIKNLILELSKKDLEQLDKQDIMFILNLLKDGYHPLIDWSKQSGASYIPRFLDQGVYASLLINIGSTKLSKLAYRIAIGSLAVSILIGVAAAVVEVEASLNSKVMKTWWPTTK